MLLVECADRPCEGMPGRECPNDVGLATQLLTAMAANA